ncbi:MAG: hypothetical protein EXR77_07260 [Myxococcales bacterium]|nr:hypothetical protein [Myxococcales bacterium]
MKLQFECARAGLCAVLLLAVASGCDEENQLSAKSSPKIEISVADKPAQFSPVCTLFDRDTLQGQLASHKKIKIRNTGSVLGATVDPLCIKWSVTKNNTQLKITVDSGLKVDEARCAGLGYKGYQAALPVNGSPLILDVEYKGNESGDNDPITITIDSNSEAKDIGLTKTQKLCFGIATTGVCADLTPKEVTFFNVTKANPATQCVEVKNCGTSDLVFSGAEFETNNAQYQIIEQPNISEVIKPKGDGANPDGHKSLKICVRYTPDANLDNEDVTLKVATNSKQGPVTALLTHKTQEEAKWSVDCSDPTGKIGFFFADPSKADKKKCKIINAGPPPLKLQDAQAAAINISDKDAVEAAFKCQVFDLGGIARPLFAIAPGKSIDFVCEYTPNGIGKPPAANATFSHSSAGISAGAMALPIAVGGCDTPAPELGPTPDLWLQAKPGQSSTGTLSVANQSCANMQLVTACVAPASYKGSEPCTAPSKNFAVEPAFSPVGVPGFGIANLQIKFAPDAKATVKNVSDLLHISYCSGTWAGNKCEGGAIVSRALNLTGAVDFDGKITPPTTTCGVVDDAAGLTKGKIVSLVAGAKGGPTFDNQTFFYRWVLSKRPVGATTWFSEAQQTTDQSNTAKLLPDLAGDYEVLCQVQAIKTDDSSTSAWSPQVPVTFTVK